MEAALGARAGKEILDDRVKNVGSVHDAPQAGVDQALANDPAQKRVDVAQEFFDRVGVAVAEYFQELLHFRAGHVRCPALHASKK
jgi:hypothetical protein